MIKFKFAQKSSKMSKTIFLERLNFDTEKYIFTIFINV